MSEELAGQALHDRAAELDIEGRSGMTADELRAAVAKAEKAQARAEAKAAKAEAEAKIVPGEHYPFTDPIPPSGEVDMGGNADNAPSVENIELPDSVHDASGGKLVWTLVPAEGNG